MVLCNVYIYHCCKSLHRIVAADASVPPWADVSGTSNIRRGICSWQQRTAWLCRGLQQWEVSEVLSRVQHGTQEMVASDHWLLCSCAAAV